MFGIALNFLLISIIIYLMWRRSEQAPLLPYFGAAIWFKITASFFSFWLYWYFYQEGDALHYYEESKKLMFLVRQDFGGYLRYLFTPIGYDQLGQMITYGYEPRMIFFIKLISPIQLITSFKPWLLGIYLGIFCFAGYWSLANTLARFYPATKMAASLAFLFFPTLVFWGSGFLKEPVALGCMAFILSYFLKIYHQERLHWLSWLGLLLAAYVFYQLRYFYAIPLFGIIGMLFFIRFFEMRFRLKPLYSLSLMAASLLLLVAAFAFMHPLFSKGVFFEKLLISYQDLVGKSSEASLIRFSSHENPVRFFFSNVPLAFFNGLFGPFILKVSNPQGILAGMERLCLFLLMIYTLVRVKKSDIVELRLVNSALLFIVAMAVIIPFATPNYGSLVRFQAAYLPLFAYLVCIIPTRKWFINKFDFALPLFYTKFATRKKSKNGK